MATTPKAKFDKIPARVASSTWGTLGHMKRQGEEITKEFVRDYIDKKFDELTAIYKAPVPEKKAAPPPVQTSSGPLPPALFGPVEVVFTALNQVSNQFTHVAISSKLYGEIDEFLSDYTSPSWFKRRELFGLKVVGSEDIDVISFGTFV